MKALSIIPLTTLAASSALQQYLHEASNSQTSLSSSSKPLVDSKALQDHITSDNLLKRAKKLFEIAQLGVEEYNHPTRVIGSDGHVGTLDYIYSTIAELGDYYELSNQSFEAVVGNIFESRLVLGDGEPKSATPMSLTPPTKNKDAVFGPLVLVANEGCDASDYPSNTTGSIALIKRGVCAFGDKSAAAGKAGAIAAVVYNSEKGSLSGTLGEPSKYHVATFGLSNEDAQQFIKKLQDGKLIPSSAYIDSIVHKAPTTNIIAQTKGGDQDNCNCVRFAWWAGEEEGLLGSDYYVSQLSEKENLKIRLFMDYDMMASPNYAYQVYNATNALNPTGSEELRDLYIDFYKSHNQNYTFIPFDGRSDYDAFIKNGIPGGGIATGAEGIKTKAEVEMFGGSAGQWYDPCYHQLCDTVDNCNLDAWEINTKLIAHSVATYAVSFKGFPERTGVSSNAQGEKSLYHGPKLVM
ncbi:Aminopeptidase Y [Lachnellula willkommii]|uniref:Peptide hydrolase n=1 Tax=Lachnellula willkommii TaxID=215461 RepID=A0A559MDE9_9HELO|nr:Aminopeptidase Y [Lachnellula willkommii]